MSTGRLRTAILGMGALALVFSACPAAAHEDGTAPGPHSLSGVVRDAGGDAVAGARLAIRLVGGCETVESIVVHAGSDGAFSIECPRLAEMNSFALDGAGFLVRASAEGFRPVAIEARVARAGGGLAARGTKIDIVLDRGAAIRGRVVDPVGLPAVGAAARLVAKDGGARPRTWHDTCDADGRFELPIERAGRFEIECARSDGGSASSGPFEAAESADVDVPDLTLDLRGVIEGTALFPDGEPIAHLSISAVPLPFGTRGVSGSGGGTTDESGRFRISGLEAERHALVPVVLGAEPLSEGVAERFLLPVVETGDDSCRVVFRVHSVTLRVRDAVQIPLAGMLISANRVEEANVSDLRRAIERDDRLSVSRIVGKSRGSTMMALGPFSSERTVHVEPESAWYFLAKPRDPAPEGSGSRALHASLEPGEAFVRVPAEPGCSAVDLVCRERSATGRIRVRFVDERGEPVNDFVCGLSQAYDVRGGGLQDVAPDADGFLPAVPPGPYGLGIQNS